MEVPVKGGARGGGSFRLNDGSGWVVGREGGLDWCVIGSRSSGISTRPLFTKTLACGLATMTLGG